MKKKKLLITSMAILFAMVLAIVINIESVKELMHLDISETDQYVENPRTLAEWQEINKNVVMVLEFDSEGVLHNIPVLEVDNGDKYMNRNLWGNYDIMGSVFIEKEVSPVATSNNWIINGHSSYNDNWGVTFLRKYSKQGYMNKNSTFQVEMADGFHVYKIVGFYEYDYDQGEDNLYFGWYNSNFTKNEASKMFMQTEPFSLSKNDGLEYSGQQLITFITCNMAKRDSRFVLMAFEI